MAMMASASSLGKSTLRVGEKFFKRALICGPAGRTIGRRFGLAGASIGTDAGAVRGAGEAFRSTGGLGAAGSRFFLNRKNTATAAKPANNRDR
jgi:hypothetical protein